MDVSLPICGLEKVCYLIRFSPLPFFFFFLFFSPDICWSLQTFKLYFTSNYHFNLQWLVRAAVPKALYKKPVLISFFPSFWESNNDNGLVSSKPLTCTCRSSSQVLLEWALCHFKQWWSSGGKSWFFIEQVSTSFRVLSCRPPLGTQHLSFL